jgi:hypothetical protein
MYIDTNWYNYNIIYIPVEQEGPKSCTIRDYRLPPRCRWNLRFSGLSRSK